MGRARWAGWTTLTRLACGRLGEVRSKACPCCVPSFAQAHKSTDASGSMGAMLYGGALMLGYLGFDGFTSTFQVWGKQQPQPLVCRLV